MPVARLSLAIMTHPFLEQLNLNHLKSKLVIKLSITFLDDQNLGFMGKR